MEARELRIGNYIQLYRKPEDKEKTVFSVDAIEDGFIALTDGFIVNTDTGIEPIPLTEEWLVKLGFKKGKKGWFKTYGSNYKFNLFMYHHILYKYVHQLQNLYYCLTGEELT